MSELALILNRQLPLRPLVETALANEVRLLEHRSSNPLRATEVAATAAKSPSGDSILAAAEPVPSCLRASSEPGEGSAAHWLQRFPTAGRGEIAAFLAAGDGFVAFG